MLTKNEIKYFSSLLNKKFRKSENKFLVEGPKLVTEAFGGLYNCEIVLTTKLFYDDNRGYFEKFVIKKIRIEVVKEIEFGKISDTKSPQGVTAVFEKRNITAAKMDQSLIVALENISDTGNLGTIIRNCDWFGIKAIILSNDCAEIYSPKVIRASAGSVFHLSIIEEGDFYSRIQEMKKDGYKIICADLRGKNLYEYNHSDKCIMVLANEANGPTNELLSIIDERITIPGRGNAESF